MANTPSYEDAYKRISAFTAAGRKTGQINLDDIIPTGTAQTAQPFQAPVAEGGFSLGQGLIDALSAGSYAVAGIGQKVGENLTAISQGDAGGALDLFNPLSAVGAAGGGIQNRRTWSDNLQDWGVEEENSFWPGLALDVALDPLWLVPGGAIVSGIKGTAKGVGLASAATKGGVSLTRPALEQAGKAGDIVFSKTGVTLPTEQFPQGGTILNNLLEGVRYGNVDEYSKWSAARQAKKDAKEAAKVAPVEPASGTLQFNQGLIDDVIKGTTPTATKVSKAVETAETAPAAEKIVNTLEDTIEEAPAVKAVSDEAKDASATIEKVENAAGTRSINQMAREEVQPLRDSYNAARGIEDPKFDYKLIEASPLADEIADAYVKMVDDPANPEVIAAYRKLADEVADQYNYMVNDLGVKVEFVDFEPYLGANGKVDSKLMMQDVAENKHMFIRKSEIDADPATGRAHPLLSNEENDMFRTVHDFFGHAASGRGFGQDGEEAAWVAHSVMFSPEARKAMTTETRGQNSYYNKFGEFAPQKAGLLPEPYILLPTEYSALERRVEGSNTFIGTAANALQEFSDELIEQLGLVSSPLRGVKAYSPEEISQIKTKLDELYQTQRYAPNTEVGKSTLRLLDVLKEMVGAPTAGKYASLGAGEGSITGLLELAQKAFDVASPGKQKANEQALAAFRQLVDQPVDATDLLESALRAEDRTINNPTPFKPTAWVTKGTEYGKPAFSLAKLTKLFPDDELLRNQEQLDLAMGNVKVKPGTKRAKDLAEKQAVIWDHFRARNHDILEDAAQVERTDWFAENSIDNSQIFIQQADGSILGQGLLPASIPSGVLTVQNGRPTTTLGVVLSNLGKVINRTGPQMGGLPGTELVGGVVRQAKPTVSKTAIKTKEGVEEIETPIAQPISEIAGKGRLAVELVGGTFVTPARKALRAKLKARGRDIELDTYPEALQDWLLTQIDNITAGVKGKGVVDRRLLDMATDTEALVTRLWNDVPAIKSRSDARMLVTLGPDAVKQLSKAPALRYFIDAPVDRLTGRPDTSGISRTTVLKGSRNEQGQILRDPVTGVPIDAKGRPVPEDQGLEGAVIDEDGVVKQGEKYSQFRIRTEDGKPFTGRVKGKYAAQTGKGAQQLAGLQAIRATLGTISEGITKGELVRSKEQAQLLGNVMQSLGIRVAENATPAKIFKQFQDEAAVAFEDVIRGLESAAKSESMVYQLKTIFPAAIKENISLMKAIERIDPADLQLRTVKWTDDAMAMVDDSCSAMYIPKRAE
jgi:hypothetical protein